MIVFFDTKMLSETQLRDVYIQIRPMRDVYIQIRDSRKMLDYFIIQSISLLVY